MWQPKHQEPSLARSRVSLKESNQLWIQRELNPQQADRCVYAHDLYFSKKTHQRSQRSQTQNRQHPMHFAKLIFSNSTTHLIAFIKKRFLTTTVIISDSSKVTWDFTSIISTIKELLPKTLCESYQIYSTSISNTWSRFEREYDNIEYSTYVHTLVILPEQTPYSYVRNVTIVISTIRFYIQ